MNKGSIQRRGRDRRGRTRQRHEHGIGRPMGPPRRNLWLRRMRVRPRQQVERRLELLQLGAVAVIVATRCGLGARRWHMGRARHYRWHPVDNGQ